MRKIVVFVSLLSVLFWSHTAPLAVDTVLNEYYTSHIAPEKQLKTTDTNSLWTVAEEGFDSIEEVHIGDKTKDKGSSIIASGNPLQAYLLLQHFFSPTFNGLSSIYKGVSFYGHCTPIYIKHRVLRI